MDFPNLLILNVSIFSQYFACPLILSTCLVLRPHRFFWGKMKLQSRFPIAHYSFALQQIVSERMLFASKIGAQTFFRLGFGPQKEWNHVGCTRTHMGATLWFQ